MMKPRLLAYDVLPAGQIAIVHINPPLQNDETTIVLTLQGSKQVVVDRVEPTKATIRNVSSAATAYVFAVIPQGLMNLFRADWRGLLSFARSLRANPLPPTPKE